jgi:hypothetical protein
MDIIPILNKIPWSIIVLILIPMKEDSQYVAYEEENHDSDNGKLVFTPVQHNALIALLQGSSSSSSHTVNHFTAKP